MTGRCAYSEMRGESFPSKQVEFALAATPPSCPPPGRVPGQGSTCIFIRNHARFVKDDGVRKVCVCKGFGVNSGKFTNGEVPFKMSKALVLKPPVDKHSRNIVRDFVYGCWCNGRRIGGMQMPPLNELYVATHARSQGLDVEFLDAQFERSRFEEYERDDYREVGAVVLMSSTQSFRSDAELLKHIKSRNPAVKGILFGSHPTFMPEVCLSAEAVDFVVRREPEATMAELLGAVLGGGDGFGLQGTVHRSPDGSVMINPARPFMEMDDLPIPDRSLLPRGIDYFNPVVKRMPYATMQTSRGCPGKCIFCTAPEFYGKRIRCRSPENVLEELRVIKSQGYREVFFRDETFTAYKSRNHEICEAMVSERLGLPWIANGRADMIDKETLVLMRKAGCHLIKFGVETSSDEILANYHKGTTAEQAEQAFRWAREAGLDTHAHIIFGGPGESEETIRQTIDFAKKIKASTASFGILTPYPGTRLFEQVAKEHPEISDGSDSNMENLHTEGFYSQSVCGMPGEILSKWIVRAYRRFYWRPVYLLGRLVRIRSLDEFMSLLLAGLNIFHFSVRGQK